MMFIPGCKCCGCDPCTAECDTTPDANFEVVYQANDTDGALQWAGDAMGPIDGPYPGFEGSGPFSQTITLAENFSVTMPGTRFPCYARIKFWRNVGGGEGSETVTSSVTITCNSGKVDIGPVVLSEGESAYFGPDPEVSGATYRLLSLDAIPLVSGGDDQSLAVIASPIYGGTAECSPSSISVTATISWSNAAIQHNLYGTFVECYDELPPGDPGDCLDCDGTPTPAPETVYLTISNFDGGGAVDGNGDPINYDGTYALSLLTPSQTTCAAYYGAASGLVARLQNGGYTTGYSIGMSANTPSTPPDGLSFLYQVPTGNQLNPVLCGTGTLSGSLNYHWIRLWPPGSGEYGSLSYDYEFSS